MNIETYGFEDKYKYQILQTIIIRIEWQTVRRINNEILGNKGLNESAKSQALYIEYFFFAFSKDS